MPLGKDYVFVQVTKPARLKLKKMAVNQEKPMHQVLAELIDQAADQQPSSIQQEDARRPGHVAAG